MKQEYVLPKFKIPGETNWIVRGVWLVGGVVLVGLAAVGFAYWRRTATAMIPPMTAHAPAQTPPAAAPPMAPVNARPGTPAPAAPAAPKTPAAPAAPGASKLALGKRVPGGRYGRFNRGGRYGKGKIARGHGRYSKRTYSLAARRAFLRKKRLLAARRANAGWDAKPAPALAKRNAAAFPAPAPKRPATASKVKDPIDDILRNFK